MAYESPGYPPIASGIRTAQAHSDWLKDQVDEITNIQWFLRALFGDADGVIAYGTVGSDSLKVEATSSVETMAVMVLKGAGFVDGVPFRLSADTQSDTMVAPSVEDRIDTIAYDPALAEIVIHTGEEGTPPVAPAILEGEIKLAEVYHRPTETAIYDADTTGEGYITDSRTFVNI